MSLLFEVSLESNKQLFNSLMREMSQVMHEATETARQYIAKTQDVKTARRMCNSAQTRWFTSNYPRILSVARSLRPLDKSFEIISNITTTALKSDSDLANPDLSKSAGFATLVKFATPALISIGNNQLVNRLGDIQAARAGVLGGQNSDESRPARVVDDSPRNDSLRGQQSSQVEKIVNDMILGLPKDMQHSARRAVSQSGNKFLALQTFMKQHKLQ